ncbi:LuxR C-terminal-related transcriptional regulator [Microbacterium sp.]|uniref:LuxR C-terminal-related transcriptional regulator n=1 Tax=Microbacterium sp. TaxID=51671 RepID=UPI002D787399|nr:LuxR C-terminal-related transcriptional regulator [Microbacterium sp.]HET6301365.1 LuxR C-terminal-related transcriptional regulator [Microbacterium sp.]
MRVQESRRIPSHAVDRPALRAQLDAGTASPLSLIVAPAGAGKTVLLGQWVASRPELAAAWIDTASDDADPLVLSRKLLAAIAEARPEFRPPLAAIATAARRLGDAYLEDLASGLHDIDPLVLIFDDLDRIAGTPVLTDLWRLVDMIPAGVHVVFASRTDLQLGWSRQRVHHDLVEIRQRELAFDEATTARVISTITGAPVTEEVATKVTVRTEGWAVGVQLTALSMRFGANPLQVVETMTETDRLITDYLGEEVLDGLSPRRRAAVIQLAVLDEFDPNLAGVVTGLDGEMLLAGLERDSLFVVPVPDRVGWYRFHRLFRDLLLLRLRAHDRDAESDLLSVASRWLSEAGDDEGAIDCAVRAHDWDRVLDLVLALERGYYESHRMGTIVRWLGEVPGRKLAERPDAAILLAMAEGMSGGAMRAVDSFRALLADGHLTPGQRQVALAYLAACVQFHPDTEFFAPVARAAVTEITRHPDAPRPDLLGLTSRHLLLTVGQVSLGRARLLLGDIHAARRIFEGALRAAGTAYRPYRVHTLGSLAMAEALSGCLVAASEHAEEALSLAREDDLLVHPAPAEAYLARALVAVQRGEAEAGALALHEGAARALSNQRTQLLWIAWLVSRAVYPEGGVAGVEEPEGPRPAFVRDALLALELRRARSRGAPLPPPNHPASWSYIAFEEIAALLALGRAAQARARMTEFAPQPEPDAPLPGVEHEILEGWLCAAEKRNPESRAHLITALRLAEPEWLVQPFVRAGAAVADLVDELPGVGNGFRSAVVNAARAAAAPPRQHLAERLTTRELELLGYLPSRLTIPGIAARCYVSTNTIKTHLGHIYRKLGVQSRDAAVERARELGLITARDAADVL